MMDQTVVGMLVQEMVEEMLEKILPQKGSTICQPTIRSTVQVHTNWRYTTVEKGGDMHALLTCRMSMHTCESGHGWGWAHHFCRFRCGVFATIFAILNLIGFFEGRGFLSVVKPARNRTNKLGCAGIVDGGGGTGTKAHLCVQLVGKKLNQYLIQDTFLPCPNPPQIA